MSELSVYADQAWDVNYNPFLGPDGDDDYVPGEGVDVTGIHDDDSVIPDGYGEPGEDDVIASPTDVDYDSGVGVSPATYEGSVPVANEWGEGSIDGGEGDHIDGDYVVEDDYALDDVDHDSGLQEDVSVDEDSGLNVLTGAGSFEEQFGNMGDFINDEEEDDEPFSQISEGDPDYGTDDDYGDDDEYDPGDALSGVLDTMDGISIGNYDDDDEDSDEKALAGFDIDEIISDGIRMGASDVHIDSNKRLAYRINGDIVRDKERGEVPYDVVTRIISKIVSHENRNSFAASRELDTSYIIHEGEFRGRRTRLNVARTMGNNAMTFRIINDRIPTPEELNVDPRIIEWTKYGKGGIILGGITGSGKDLHEDTWIPGPYYPGGFARIRDVKPGDTVYDENGLYCRVLGKYLGGSERFFNIHFPHVGETVLAGGNHLWNVGMVGECAGGCGFLPLGRGDVAGLFRVLLSAGDDDRATPVEIVSMAGIRGEAASRVEAVFTETFQGDRVLVRKSCAHVLEMYLEQTREHVEGGHVVRTLTTQQMFEEYQKHGPRMLIRGLTGAVEHGTHVDPQVGVEGFKRLLDTSEAATVLSSACSWSVYNRASLLHELVTEEDSDEQTLSIIVEDNKAREIVLSVAQSLGVHARFEGNNRVVIRGLHEEWDCPNNGDTDLTDESRTGYHWIGAIEEVKADGSDFYCLEVDSPSHLFLCTKAYVPTHNTTTFASLVRDLQLTTKQRIITIEKPIEFLYPDDCETLITQREVGDDTLKFSAALKAAMRQDPNTILVGEVRDREEVDEFLRASESGHLSMTTIHSNTPAVTLNRIKSLYEGDDQRRILSTLQNNVRILANQELLKTADNKSRFALFSVLEVTREVQHMIGDGNDRGIEDYMRDNNLTIEYQIANAVKDGRCTREEGMAHAADLIYFKRLLGKDSTTIA